jgi:hypothetical protein
MREHLGGEAAQVRCLPEVRDELLNCFLVTGRAGQSAPQVPEPVKDLSLNEGIPVQSLELVHNAYPGMVAGPGDQGQRERDWLSQLLAQRTASCLRRRFLVKAGYRLWCNQPPGMTVCLSGPGSLCHGLRS